MIQPTVKKINWLEPFWGPRKAKACFDPLGLQNIFCPETQPIKSNRFKDLTFFLKAMVATYLHSAAGSHGFGYAPSAAYDGGSEGAARAAPGTPTDRNDGKARGGRHAHHGGALCSPPPLSAYVTSWGSGTCCSLAVWVVFSQKLIRNWCWPSTLSDWGLETPDFDRR